MPCCARGPAPTVTWRAAPPPQPEGPTAWQRSC
jgi:hypothetical protein